MKKFLFNNKVLRHRRKKLRREQTVAEGILWQGLRNRQIKKLKFYRQYSVGPYILDFYCPEIHLAIELDGESHDNADAKVYDVERTSYLESLGIKVMRFKNEEVMNDVEEVLGKIMHNLQ